MEFKRGGQRKKQNEMYQGLLEKIPYVRVAVLDIVKMRGFLSALRESTYPGEHKSSSLKI